MKNLILPVFFIALLVACGNKKSNDKQQDGNEEHVESKPYILLDSTHSIMRNTGKDVPYYYIPNLDSFTVDITGYQFILPSPAFDYIGEGINYPEMLGGSFAYMLLLYNDSLEIHPNNLVEPNTLVEIDENKKFVIRGIKDEFKGEAPKEFILAFMFYIDNGKGEQEIDQFKVKVVP